LKSDLPESSGLRDSKDSRVFDADAARVVAPERGPTRASSSFRVPFHRWVFREGADFAGEIGFIDAMLRRRLSPLAKSTLAVARECSEGFPDVRLVHASRHGEITRTVAMLEDIAEGEGVSPAGFSLSVLNATAGLFSLIFQNVEATTAISAGPSSFGYGLIDAALRFVEAPSKPVLYIYSDEPLPAIYGASRVEESASVVALALLFHETAETALECSLSAASSAGASDASAESQASAFLRCLERGASDWSDGDKTWSWRRVRFT
jgi:hypothetical protein